jgi:hypothetical protein
MKSRTSIKRLLLLIASAAILEAPSLAGADSGEGIGAIAGQLMEPVQILSNFVGNGSIIVGVSCLFAAFMRYMQHRVNPLAFPIGSVWVLLILGVVLVCLPFTYLLTGAGIPFPAHGSRPYRW